jgi:hypothetical protein
MLTDPQTITVSAVAQVMARTSLSDNAGTFTKDDGTYQLKLSHQYGKRTRRSLRVDVQKIAANPFDSSLNERVSASFYLVADVPPNGQGYTIAEQKAILDGLMVYLTASSGAVMLKLLGGEI